MAAKTIFDAVKAGDCEQLLLNISQVNHINEDGDTPLLVAVQKRQLKVVKILLEHGADKEATNKEGKTAVHTAIKPGRLEIIILLLDHGANIEARDTKGSVPLLQAIDENQPLIAKLLLQRGANVNTAADGGATPLINAAWYGYEDMVKLLLQHGADHSLGTTELDNTALYWASDKGHHDIAKILLDAGANPFHKTQTSSSVLSTGKDESMKRLIREYQRADGPSWLVRELSKRDLEWSVVCDTQDTLQKAHITSRESLARIPSAKFTDAYLQGIGIDTLTVRCALLEMRAQVTWLGARLASEKMSVANILILEAVVFDGLVCSTEALFAALPVSALNDIALSRLHTSDAMRNRLRAVHQQVRAEHAVTTSTKTVEPGQLNANYQQFMTDSTASFELKYPDVSNMSILFMAGHAWSLLTPAQKGSYHMCEEEAKHNYFVKRPEHLDMINVLAAHDVRLQGRGSVQKVAVTVEQERLLQSGESTTEDAHTQSLPGQDVPLPPSTHSTRDCSPDSGDASACSSDSEHSGEGGYTMVGDEK